MIAPNQDMAKPSSFDVRILRQAGPGQPERWERFRLPYEPNLNVISVLQKIARMAKTAAGESTTPVAWDCNCLEEVCGACTMVINGRVRQSCSALVDKLLEERPGEIELRPMSKFPVVRDLVVDRSAFDRIIAAGGYVSSHTGSAPDGNAIPIDKETADLAMDAAACIGCGACVAACPNAAAMLFTSAKVSHLSLLPQGDPERSRRVTAMVETMDAEGFGNCTNHYECMAACPKGIHVDNIARMNREYLKASVASRDLGSS